jgi:hypothetical protein
MKKALILLLLVAMVAPVFAGDANVLPKGVGRLYIVPAFSTWSQAWDDDSKKDDSALGDASSFNIASALEYGVTPFLSVGLQYIPGYVISNDFSDQEKVDATGTGNLDIGAKIQVIGPSGLVPNETMRLSFLPGVFLPLSSYDAKSEATASEANDEFALDGVANSSFGAGLQTAFDYFITPNFYINLFNEIRLHTAEDFAEAGIEAYGTWAFASGSSQQQGGPALSEPGEVYPGYDLKLEIEPTFQTPISESVNFTGSLAATWAYSPGQSFVEDLTPAQGGAALQSRIEDTVFSEEQTVSLGPSVAFFVTSLPLPMEFQLDATIPVWGQNAQARNTFAFQWEIYFAF